MEKAQKEQEANIDLINTWDDIQARIDADYQLAQRLGSSNDVIPLAVRTLIISWKINKEGKKSYCQIIRIGGKKQMYLIFSHMLRSFDREDLEDLYKLVKAKYGSTRPKEDLDLVLWNDLKNMFKPHVEDTIWRRQYGYKVLEWKLYDSCGVHTLRLRSMQIYMLVKKKYPFTPPILTMILNKKLKADHQLNVLSAS
uniref:Uncharacterized protein n=1 Tax=Tanacetum cinerariifolium TaxID=118510 RepID=A0A6L2J888_TANCI|nr:hypothetical protein [Tanacetum cinerariifolium]